MQISIPALCAIVITGDDARLHFCVVQRLQTGEEALWACVTTYLMFTILLSDAADRPMPDTICYTGILRRMDLHAWSYISHQKHREISQYPAADSHEGSELMCMHGRVETLSSATTVALLRSLETRQRMRHTCLIRPLSSGCVDVWELHLNP
jgi:hypothetical protein